MRKTVFKIMLLAVPAMAALNANAQIEKGTKFVGGNFNLRTNNTDAMSPGQLQSSNSVSFSVNPRAGVYLCKSFALGIGLGFGLDNSSTTTSGGSSPYKQSNRTMSYGAYVFGRYNKFIGRKFAFFTDISAGYSLDRYRSKDQPIPGTPVIGKAHGGTFAASAIPGISYFVNPRFGIEATYGSLEYNSYVAKNKDNPGYKQTGSSLNLNMALSSVSLGMSYYFRCKPKHKVSEEEAE